MYICSMYSKELLKGTLSTIVLALLKERGKMYGYEITREVKERTEGKILIKEGSLYPALHRLQADGFVTTEELSLGKRTRIYYMLTETGKSKREEQVSELQNFMETIRQLIIPASTPFYGIAH